MSIPSAFAVFRLMTRVELGCLLNGQLTGLVALQYAANIDAGLTMRIDEARTIAHQPTGFGKIGNVAREPVISRGSRAQPISRGTVKKALLAGR